MAQIFKQAANKIIATHLVLPVGFVFILMFLVACGLFVEDYSTSLLGYQSLPTNKANDWVIWLVALVPQLAQIAFGYTFLEDTNKKWAFLILVLAHFIDVFTDVWFKIAPPAPEFLLIAGWNIPLWIIAFVESEGLYTIGSELMLVTSVGVLAAIFPQFLVKFHELYVGIGKAWQKFTKGANLTDLVVGLGFISREEESKETSKRGRKSSVPEEIENIRRPRPVENLDHERPTKPNGTPIIKPNSGKPNLPNIADKRREEFLAREGK